MDSLLPSVDDIRGNVENGKPTIFRAATFDGAKTDAIVTALKMYVSSFEKDVVFEYLAYCMRELIDNARKANIKRIFFAEDGLDIHDEDDYKKGMAVFAERIRENRSHYETLLSSGKFFIEVSFRIDSPTLRIMVSNNSEMLEIEQRRVLSKFTKAAIHNTIVEVMEDIGDATESAGLGLVTVSMLLRKIGVPEGRFRFDSGHGWTRFKMAIPESLITDEETERISEDLIREIETIPQFPDHILSLTELLKDTAFDFKKVARLIRKDPALTLEVLHMTNSAYYRRYNKIESIEMAIGILGIRGLNVILQSFGARKALENRYSGEMLTRLWEHSSEIAQTCSMLCTRFGSAEEESEAAYIGGLLHDMGKIVLEGRHPRTFSALATICMRKNTSVVAIEDLIEGVNHAVIGAKMAAKWNLPERIVEVIRSYRTPQSAPEEVRRVARILYLAHVLSHRMHPGEKEYEAGDDLLTELGLDTGDTLDDLAAQAAQLIHSAAQGGVESDL